MFFSKNSEQQQTIYTTRPLERPQNYLKKSQGLLKTFKIEEIKLHL